MSSLLVASDIDFSYGGPPVLQGVELKCETCTGGGVAAGGGDMVAIIGPNGAGKSTLLQVLTGYLRPDRGRVELNGKDLRELSRREIAGQVAYVPQRAPAGFGFTVAEMVLMGRQPYRGLAALDTEDDRRIARESLAAAGVDHLVAKLYDSISGGEQQLVMLARALAQRAAILVLDEPTSSLDLHAQWGLLTLLKAMCSRENAAVATFHDLNLASRWCTRMVLLSGGRVVAAGEPAEVMRRDVLEEVYRVRLKVEQRDGGNMHVEFPE